MGRSLIISGLVVAPLLLSVLLTPGVSGTAPLVIGTATVLTANQIGALIAVGLAIKVVAIKAALIGGALAGRRGGRRGRRAAELSPLEVYDIETLVELEEEDCYKRIFCAAATEKLENINVSNVLQLLEKDFTRLNAPLSLGAEKFLTAANYGKLSGSVEKCENRYQCPLKLDVVQTLF